MTREIKFRAWDKEKSRMTNEFIVKNDGSLRIWDGSGWGENQYTQNLGSTLMQYTGLKDRKGKEIYEGDICKKWNYTKPENDYSDGKPFLVHWSQTNCSFCIRKAYPHKKIEGKMAWEYEVIGNIYENPELLSANK